MNQLARLQSQDPSAKLIDIHAVSSLQPLANGPKLLLGEAASLQLELGFNPVRMDLLGCGKCLSNGPIASATLHTLWPSSPRNNLPPCHCGRSKTRGLAASATNKEHTWHMEKLPFMRHPVWETPARFLPCHVKYYGTNEKRPPFWNTMEGLLTYCFFAKLDAELTLGCLWLNH